MMATTSADPREQHRLVLRAERADRETLEPFGRAVDRRRPHREHRGRFAADEPGDQVGDADRDGGGDQPHEGAQDPMGWNGCGRRPTGPWGRVGS